MRVHGRIARNDGVVASRNNRPNSTRVLMHLQCHALEKKTIFITSSFAGARLFKTALPAVISYVSVPVQSLQVGGVGVGSYWCPKNDPIGIVPACGSN